MKKFFIITFIILGILFTLTACGNNNSNNIHLKILATSWAFSDKLEESEEEFNYDIKLNEKYVVKEGSLGLTFTVTKINKDSIVIKTTEPFSDSEDSVNLKSDKKEFIIEKGKQIKLSTPTMDAGGIYTFILD